MVAAAGFALAACGSGDDGGSSEETSTAGTDPMAAYTECIAEQGIELPEDWSAGFGGGEMPSFDPENAPSDMPTDMPTDMPSGGFGGGGFSAPEGVSDEDWAVAQEACMSTLPQGGGFPGSGS
ncbi:hypothetical protein SAMN05216298_0345 [Glycomyces sambucus]|uniref:PT repeat-containing protein n=1 Tax=Glycomyces sambucus TaxID=380244 RepID=A0A1G9CHV5_9ACTN|nr:hypothetical protein [Glycomyces sambucus]SDK51219.1 hypothetical protein SAMN05216298_0345 [Glycomyces sambucus]